MKKDYLFYAGLILSIFLIWGVLAWALTALTKDKAKKEKNFFECIEATKCYKCVSISNEISTAEYCGLEQNPFFQELDKSNVEWCYDKFIK